MSEKQLKEENSVRNKDWKKGLSGALSDIQIKIAMMVLSLFSTVYTLYNAFVVKSNEQDEGDVIRNCTCKESHRNFYIGWSAFCFILWFIFHLLYFLYTTAPCQCAKKPMEDLKARFSYRKRKLLASLSTTLCKKKDDDNVDQGENQYTKERRGRGWQCIYQYQELILSRLREKNAIGCKMPNHRMDVTEAIQLLLSIELCKEETENDFRRSQPHSEQGDEPDGEQGDEPDGEHNSVTNTSFVVTKPTIYGRIIKNTSHLLNILLRLVRFIVQLSVVPLLMVQIFDTYTFLCLIESEQCDRISQYRVHLVQTAVSFSFYASLMISLLTTIWLLKLVPWEHYHLSMPVLNMEPLLNCYTTIQNDHQQQSPNIDINYNNNSTIIRAWICK